MRQGDFPVAIDRLNTLVAQAEDGDITAKKRALHLAVRRA
jgi:hypothetical protein